MFIVLSPSFMRLKGQKYVLEYIRLFFFKWYFSIIIQIMKYIFLSLAYISLKCTKKGIFWSLHSQGPKPLNIWYNMQIKHLAICSDCFKPPLLTLMKILQYIMHFWLLVLEKYICLVFFKVLKLDLIFQESNFDLRENCIFQQYSYGWNLV